MTDKNQSIRDAFNKFLNNPAEFSAEQANQLAKDMCELVDPDEMPEILNATMQATRAIAEKHRQALKQAMIDDMTGLANRAGFDKELHVILSRMERGAPLKASIVYVDLNKFKEINDYYGHEAGDKALTVFADALKDFVRDTDIPARIGGDEFALILVDEKGNNPEYLTGALNRLNTHLQGLNFEWNEQELPLSASVGVSAIDPAKDAGENLAGADRAMYQAKQAGRIAGHAPGRF